MLVELPRNKIRFIKNGKKNENKKRESRCEMIWWAGNKTKIDLFYLNLHKLDEIMFRCFIHSAVDTYMVCWNTKQFGGLTPRFSLGFGFSISLFFCIGISKSKHFFSTISSLNTHLMLVE